MNRTILLVALFLLLGAAAWYAITQKNRQTASHVSWDMDFAIKDPNTIGKIFIADRQGQSALLERKGNDWWYNGACCARPTAMENMLNTITNVNVLNIPANAAVKDMVKEIAAIGKKVEIYDRNDKLLKTYYIGGVTIDERGTVFMMDKSEQPYVVHVPGFIGSVGRHFLIGDEDWRDRTVFRENPEDIQSVWVEYPQRKSDSFKLEKVEEATYKVSPYFSTTPPLRTPQRKGVPEAYLVQFEKLVAEGFENTNTLRDSVKALVPFAILSLKRTNGSEMKVRFWPVEVEYRTDNGLPYVSRYFADVDNKDFMLTQDLVFGKLFRGYDYFFEGVPEKDRLKN